jgi:hypothetical protein
MTTTHRQSRSKRTLLWLLLGALLILHHDWWFWTSTYLVFGFLPVGLAYHMLISVAAGGLWAWAAWCNWPEEFDEDLAEEHST